MTRLLLLLSVFSTPALAFNGSVNFSSAEISHHRQTVGQIIEIAQKCLDQDLARHHDFLRKYGISAFYGENAPFIVRTERDPWTGQELRTRTSIEERRDMLRARGLSESLVQQMVPSRSCRGRGDCPLRLEPTSCIGITLKCLQQGFEATGGGATWKTLRAFTRINDVTGDSLQHALQKLGWSLAYWNPAPQKASEWDAAERRAYPGNPKGIWGRHAQTLATVMSSGRYSQNRVDDVRSLVGFGTSTPELIARVPFFVGIAHQGYHVFAGSYGRIVEGHSTRAITDRQTLESSPFNPLVKGGGPRGGPYKSGVVALPPGYLN